MHQPDLINDYLPAIAARDKALAQVELHADGYVDEALTVLEQILPLLPETFLPEDFRVLITQQIGEPKNSKNVFGPIAIKAMKRGLIVPTGDTAVRSSRHHTQQFHLSTVLAGCGSE